MKSLLKVLFNFFYKVKVNDISNYKEGKKLIISNHQSFLDGLLLAIYLPFKTTFVVHTTVLKNPFFKFLLSFINYVAVDTTKPMALKTISKLLNQGESVVIFPEGRITTTGNLMKIYNGTSFIAYKTDSDIVPIRLEGAVYTKFSRKHKLPRKLFHPITINIFPVQHIQIDQNEGLTVKQKRKKSSEQMREIMQETMFLAQPKDTLYKRFLNTMNLYGKDYSILTDKDQLEDSSVPALTYKDLLVRILGLGKAISKVTDEKENVGVLLPNVAVTPALILGLNIFNRNPAMLNYTLGEKGLQLACETANIKTIVTSKKFIEMMKDKLAPALAELKNVNFVYLEDVKANMTLADKLWLMLYAVRFPQHFTKTQNSDDTAVILFTSGSESVPKGVVLSHKSLLSNVDQCKTVIDLTPEDKVLNVLPLFHSFGLTGGTLLPLLTGTPIILYPSPLHYRIIPEIAYDKSATVLFGTNTFLAQYGKNADNMDFHRMRYVVAGAEKLNEEVKNMWFNKFGIRIFEGYGATECAPVLSVNTPAFYKEGSVGKLLPNIESKIIPIAGVEEGGELHVKGPNLMNGYLIHNTPGIVKAKSEAGDGWYNTGDIVNIDKDGFVFIKGRTKRIIKVAGEMIPLDLVEKISQNANVDFQYACVSKADKDKGESLVLFTTNPELKKENISRIAKELGYSELFVPKDIRFISEIPVLGSGKTDYVSLKNLI